jgi:deazaflavin-dependent oxidoreductase (nitroreductase family)
MSQAALVNGSRGRNIKETDRRFIRVLIGAHRRLLGASSGRLLGRMGGHPLLILTTSGRRTGQPYSTPVIGIASGPDWLVVASNGGAATQPLWVRNIEAGPQVTVRRGKRTESFQPGSCPPRNAPSGGRSWSRHTPLTAKCRPRPTVNFPSSCSPVPIPVAVSLGLGPQA